MERLDEWRKSPKINFIAKPFREKINLIFPGLVPAFGLFVGYVFFDQAYRLIWPVEHHPDQDIFSYNFKTNNNDNHDKIGKSHH